MKHEINSYNTKKMFANTLVTLLHKKSISKIKVSELVTLCNVNRKTFYYHFDDVYAVLEWHLNEEIQKAITEINPLDNINVTIDFATNYTNNNTYLRNCIDTPLGRDIVVKFLDKNLYPRINEIFSQLIQLYNKEFEEGFKQFLVKNMTHITVLSIIDNIENPNNNDIECVKQYISEIFKLSFDAFSKTNA